MNQSPDRTIPEQLAHLEYELEQAHALASLMEAENAPADTEASVPDDERLELLREDVRRNQAKLATILASQARRLSAVGRAESLRQAKEDRTRTKNRRKNKTARASRRANRKHKS